jgi:two-component system response regulator GlrR
MPPPDSNRPSDVLPLDTPSAAATARQEKLKAKIALAQIVGESPAFLAQLEKLPRFAASKATVLISGESGTGKEVFARALHYLSPRAGGPFVPVNCGALPEQLVESEIFGHKRGAFTGALADQAGLIQQAESGTLFLDEVDALTRPAQVKLLRLLQDGEYRAVGGQGVVRGDIRIIAASNANLARLVSDGGFREDLFYRLNVLELVLPPLRERRGDLLLLADHILEKQTAAAGSGPKKLSLVALNRLFTHSWPGNVRELENVLTRAIVLCGGDTIGLSDLNLPDEGGAEENLSFQTSKSRAVRRFEHDFLEATLRAHQGNITNAARAAKKNRRAFWELLRKHGLLDSSKRE